MLLAVLYSCETWVINKKSQDPHTAITNYNNQSGHMEQISSDRIVQNRVANKIWGKMW